MQNNYVHIYPNVMLPIIHTILYGWHKYHKNVYQYQINKTACLQLYPVKIPT